MKEIFVSDLLRRVGNATTIELHGWIASKRCQGKVIFLDVCDSTGKIQVVISGNDVPSRMFDSVKHWPVESGVTVHGALVHSPKGQPELHAIDITLVGGVTKEFSPHPRSQIDIFDEGLIPHLLTNRHMYIRNPKVMAILQFRDCLMHYMRTWFHSNRYTSIEAPILTPVPLYDDGTAMPITVHDEKVYLTQCVGYYLEAAVHAFERVFNIGPSFRGEEGRSKRHLMEYWHIKAEVAWCNLDDIIASVENIVSYLTKKCTEEQGLTIHAALGTNLCTDGLVTPYPRISYEDAIRLLSCKGIQTEFGKSLSSDCEAELSKHFPGRPFWVTGIPRTIEPFPYVIDPDDARITRVADLIASNGYGELLGTAEKISDIQMLDERLRDKNKGGDARFEFVRDVHQVGCIPHAAFGMGVERMVRWMLNIPHVRDCIPFPRTFKRSITP
ncbi:MAG: asparagine--tRNA ligase [bacterium]|nr:asparagine--tRNA ligase [bacterium]